MILLRYINIEVGHVEGLLRRNVRLRAEITVAGNLIDMFVHLTPANDLQFRRGTDAPTVRVEGMTLAGA